MSFEKFENIAKKHMKNIEQRYPDIDVKLISDVEGLPSELLDCYLYEKDGLRKACIVADSAGMKYQIFTASGAVVSFVEAVEEYRAEAADEVSDGELQTLALCFTIKLCKSKRSGREYYTVEYGEIKE